MAAIIGGGLAAADSWEQLRRSDVLLVRGDGDCGYSFRGRSYSPMVDSIGDLLTERGLAVCAVAKPYARLVGDRAHFDPVSCNRSTAIAELGGIVVRMRSGREARVRWLKQRKIDLWSRMLRLSGARFVIAINPDAELCRAARLCAVTVYDMQHGVVDAGNPWYDERSGASVDAQDLPHGFLCWDEASADYLRGWAPQKGLHVHIIGNPWFARFSRRDARDVLVQEALSATPRLRDERGTILVSLQWGLKSFFYADTSFNGVLADALEQTICSTAQRYRWLLRLHPNQLRGPDGEATLAYLQATYGAFATVEWEHASRAPLPLVLSEVDLHITDSSSVVIEAGWLGLKSALLNPLFQPGARFSHMYSQQRNAGLAELLPQDADSIKSWIECNLDRSRAARAPHYDDAAAGLVAEIQESCR